MCYFISFRVNLELELGIFLVICSLNLTEEFIRAQEKGHPVFWDNRFPIGQATFHIHLPNGQGPRQAKT